MLAGLLGWPSDPLRVPILAIASGAVALMGISYAPVLRRYGLPIGCVVTLPLAAILYTAMTFTSAWRTWLGRETAWKSRPTTRL